MSDDDLKQAIIIMIDDFIAGEEKGKQFLSYFKGGDKQCVLV